MRVNEHDKGVFDIVDILRKEFIVKTHLNFGCQTKIWGEVDIAGYNPDKYLLLLDEHKCHFSESTKRKYTSQLHNMINRLLPNIHLFPEFDWIGEVKEVRLYASTRNVYSESGFYMPLQHRVIM